MDELNFNEFTSISDQEYLDKIRKELKDKSLEHILEQNALDGVLYSPANLDGTKNVQNFTLPISTDHSVHTHLDLDTFWKNNDDLVPLVSKLVDSVSIAINTPEELIEFHKKYNSVVNSVAIKPNFDFNIWLQQENRNTLLNVPALKWVNCDPILSNFRDSEEPKYKEINPSELFDFLGFLKEHSKIKGLGIQSCNLKDAGATIVQEIAYTLNLINEYIELAKSNNFPLSSLHDQMVISMAHHTDYFMEMAKYRAFRIVYQTLINSHGLSSNNTVVIHGRDSVLKLGRKDVDLNLLRHTTGAMSAITGGVDKVECLLHTYQHQNIEDAFRLAGNTMLLLKHESDIGAIKDPAAGSKLIDGLTLTLAEKAWEEFKKIEKNGGFLACVSNGMISEYIEQSANQKRKDFESGKIKMVGANVFARDEDSTPSQLKTTSSFGFKPLILDC